MKLKNITKTAVINKDNDPDVVTHSEFLFTLKKAVLQLEQRIVQLENQNTILKELLRKK